MNETIKQAKAKAVAFAIDVKRNFKPSEGLSGFLAVKSRFCNLWTSGRNGKVVCVGGGVLLLLLAKICLFSGENGSVSGCPRYLIDSVAEERDQHNKEMPYFPLGDFSVEAFEIKPAVDNIGCYGECQSVKAVVRFRPIEKAYYWRLSQTTIIERFNVLRIGVGDAHKEIVDCMPEHQKVVGKIDKLNDITPDTRVRMSEDDVKVVHCAVYACIMNKDKNGDWKPIKNGGFSLLTFHDEIGGICTAKAVRGRYIVLCDNNGSPDSAGRKFIETYRNMQKSLSGLCTRVDGIVSWYDWFKSADGKDPDDMTAMPYPAIEGDKEYERLNAEYRRLTEERKKTAEELESHRSECERLEKQLYSINGEYERRRLQTSKKSLAKAQEESNDASSKQKSKFARMAASIKTDEIERTTQELNKKLADAKTVNRARIEAYTAAKEANDKIVDPIKEKLQKLTKERSVAWEALVAYERKTASEKLKTLSATYRELVKVAEAGIPYPYPK